MPELPEVETTRRGIAPHCEGRQIRAAIVRDARLRWPVPADLPERLAGKAIGSVSRRGKYLLFELPGGHLLMHLGMSGSLRVVKEAEPAGIHDHIDLVLAGGQALRYNDPRRFGCCLWLDGAEPLHPLLADLGPEPLSDEFDGDLLYRLSRGRRGPVKNFIMDGHIVVGVGNIYANEALFSAGIRPDRAAGRISLARYRRLADEIRRVLQRSITQGGTTLRDFVGGDGKPGYFRQQLNVYGREGQPCRQCGQPLRLQRLGQRATTFCIACQR